LTSPLQSIRKYGQYHRPIARPILFRLDGDCFMSPGRTRASLRSGDLKALIARGFHKPGDVENRLGYYLAKSRARPASDAILNSGTLRMGGVRSHLGGHVSKVCGDVLHFLHEGGLYVSESQRRKVCSAKRSPASPTRAGGFQNHLVRRCRLETVPGVPTFRPAGRRCGSASTIVENRD
jgi:hypothetical protein